MVKLKKPTPKIFLCLSIVVWYICASLNQDDSSCEVKTFTATFSPFHVPLTTSPNRPFPTTSQTLICLAMVLWASNGRPAPLPKEKTAHIKNSLSTYNSQTWRRGLRKMAISLYTSPMISRRYDLVGMPSRRKSRHKNCTTTKIIIN